MITFNNILYVYSDATDNEVAIQRAVALAKKNHAQLSVLFTITDESFPEDLGLSQADIVNYLEQLEEQRLSFLQDLSRTINIKHESIHNDSYTEVIKKVKQHNYDLLIKPSKNEGVIGKLLGSNDMGYLRQCPCSVLLIEVDSTEPQPSHCIIAAIDVEENHPEDEASVRKSLNVDILTKAASLALAYHCQLKVVSVWSAQFEKTLRSAAFIKNNTHDVDSYVNTVELAHKNNLAAFMDNAKETIGNEVFSAIQPECISIKGNPKEVIPEYAKTVNADLVVMGTVGRVGIPGLIIGNTAENILYRLHRSLLAIKPEGFKTSND